jgi:hypothetical protein
VIAVRPALIALLALLTLAAPAAAQEQSKRVQRVYRDYRDDGVIAACKHERAALKETLDELPDSADLDTPDLRPALEAAIQQHKDGDCKNADQQDSSGSGSSSGSSGSTGSSTPVPSATVAPPVTGEGATGATPLNPPANTPDATPSAPRTIAPDDGGDSPAAGKATPVPQATPTPTPVPAAPAEPTGPVATPTLVYSNPDDSLPPALLVPLAVAALLALLALLYAFAARTGRLPGPRRAAREAAFRLGGTWGDFADWLRAGR